MGIGLSGGGAEGGMTVVCFVGACLQHHLKESIGGNLRTAGASEIQIRYTCALEKKTQGKPPGQLNAASVCFH